MVYTPPMNIAVRDRNQKSIFLAGSIEMGKAENWQDEAINFLTSKKNSSLINIFNPRKDVWNTETPLEFENPEFFQQVSWELNALEQSDLIIMNFIPETISPISLLELGRFGTSGKIRVACPKNYWRSGNVEIFCNRYNIPLYSNLHDLLICI